MTASERVRYDLAANGVATVTLDDPKTRNALGRQMLDELIGALERARDDARVRCVVLASSHPTVFSAGGDLAEFGAQAPTLEKHLGMARLPTLFRLVRGLGKPTLCAARGHVLAGALGVALACDLVVAADTAEFGTPELNVGLFPFMVMALLYRDVGRKRANELLLLGERMTAAEAREAGIVNRVVAAEGFAPAVADWAAKLAARSPVMMRLGKEAMCRSEDMPLADALDYLHHRLTLALSTDDAAEGIGAFFERREPEWGDR